MFPGPHQVHQVLARVVYLVLSVLRRTRSASVRSAWLPRLRRPGASGPGPPSCGHHRNASCKARPNAAAAGWAARPSSFNALRCPMAHHVILILQTLTRARRAGFAASFWPPPARRKRFAGLPPILLKRILQNLQRRSMAGTQLGQSMGGADSEKRIGLARALLYSLSCAVVVATGQGSDSAAAHRLVFIGKHTYQCFHDRWAVMSDIAQFTGCLIAHIRVRVRGITSPTSRWRPDRYLPGPSWPSGGYSCPRLVPQQLHQEGNTRMRPWSDQAQNSRHGLRALAASGFSSARTPATMGSGSLSPNSPNASLARRCVS